jgi:hypothetical protein
MTKLDITTTFLQAIWGAVVSTALAYISMHEYYHSRKLHMQVSFYPDAPPTDIIRDWKKCCEIHVVNKGKRPVTIEDLALQLSDGSTFKPEHFAYRICPDLPVTLAESQVVSAFLLREKVPMENVVLAFARATDGSIYKSR